MRVLILAHDFPPLNSVGGRRPYSWFNYFKDFGIEPIVITKAWDDKSDSVQSIFTQQQTRGISIENHPGGIIIKTPIVKILPERMYARYGEKKFRWIRKLLSLFFKLGAFPFLSFDKNRLIYREAKKFLKENKADVIIATGEPFILFKYASKLSKHFGIPWIADYRDGWFIETISQYQNSLFLNALKRYEKRFEMKFLKSAAFITTVDETLQKKISALHNKETFIVRNGFENFYDGPLKNPHPEKVILSHSGTIYQGHQVEVLLQSILELDEAKLVNPQDVEINFYGLDFFPVQRNRVFGYSKTVSEYIKSTPRIPQTQVLYELSGSDYLLVFTDPDFSMVPSKVYEYVSLEKPVIGILNDHNLLESFLRNLDAGILFNTKTELKDFLVSAVKANRAGRPFKKNSTDKLKASQYSRYNQAKIFAELIIGKLNH